MTWDLLVLGGGSAGVRAARFAASFGAKVALVEDRWLGGTCVNAGCIPKKLFVYGSELPHALEDARAYGHTVDGARFDMATLTASTQAETARLRGIYRSLLMDTGVTVIDGRGTFVAKDTVEVNGERHTARHVLVVTGSKPERLPVTGGELGITSDDVFAIPALPKRLAVLGAGYIAVELACVFANLGTDVTIVHRGDEILRSFDVDVRKHLREELAKRGVSLRLGTKVQAIERTGEGYVLRTSTGDLAATEVLHAIGRTPNTQGLGLETIGVTLNERGGIVVDAAYQTNVPGVLACGDVIDHVQLTPIALAEGMWIARRYFGGLDPAPIDYTLVPTAVFSQPTVGTVGMTEAKAREAHEVVIFRTSFRPLKNTVSGRDERTMMKVIVDRATDKVLGIHMVGPDAGEIIQGFAVAMTCGVTKAQLDATIGIHPTAAEELVTLRSPVA